MERGGHDSIKRLTYFLQNKKHVSLFEKGIMSVFLHKPLIRSYAFFDKNINKPLSFPSMRESTGNIIKSLWIPAFVGITGSQCVTPV